MANLQIVVRPTSTNTSSMSEDKEKGSTLEILGKLFAKWAKWDIWWFNASDWLGFLNRLKKHEIQGLLTGTYVLVERIKYHSATFKTVTIGGAKGIHELLTTIRETTWKIEAGSIDIIKTSLGVEAEVYEIDLVLASKKDLGLPVKASIDQVFTRARELGLECCPDETGLRICPVHFYPAGGKTLVVATQGIVNPINGENTFLLLSFPDLMTGKVLSHGSGKKDYRGYEHDEFVFVRPRPSK